MIATIGAIGFAAVGLMFLLLAVLLLTSWRGQRVGSFLIAACLASAVWGGVLALDAAFVRVSPAGLALIEVLRASSWMVFLVYVASRIGVSRMLRGTAVAAAVALAGAILATAVTTDIGSQGAAVARILLPGSLMMALLGLILIEQIYRNSPPESRWSLKPLVLGIGGMFAYDLFLYSQGVLLSAIDATSWLARGAVNVLFVPLIAIAARRNVDWELKIFVSRQVVFYSATLIAVGFYLLLMGLGGYLIVRYGGTWGGFAQVIFLVGAGVVLLILLFSVTMRARLRVFLNKHFFHNKYDYREEWLRLVATLGAFDYKSGREVTIRALAQVVGSTGGVLWVRRDDPPGFRTAATYNLDVDIADLAIDDPLVEFIQESDWVVDLKELAENPGHYDGLQRPAALERLSAAWLVVPLLSQFELQGLIMLTDAPGAGRLNYEDRDLLKTVGSHIAVHLAQARSDRMLAEAQQFEAYNRLTAFLMHDLNNLIAQQSLIVENAEKHKRNPDFVDDAITTIAGSVERMRGVMQRLKSGGKGESSKTTDVKFIVSAAVDRCASRSPAPKLDLNGVDAKVDLNAEEFTMVLTHLIKNAQDATPEDGDVSVSLTASDSDVTVQVSDNGSGMSPEFIRERLFRPFDSTKGSQGMGIGAYQAREFAARLKGELSIDSEPGRGTVVSVSIPRA